MRKSVKLLCLLALAGVQCSIASAQIAIDCEGTIYSWGITNPDYAKTCHCVASNQMPVCTYGQNTGINSSGGLMPFFGFNRISLLGGETGSAFYSSSYRSAFEDWNNDFQARYDSWPEISWFYRGAPALRHPNPAAAVVDWAYKKLAGIKKDAPAVKTDPSANFKDSWGTPEDLKQYDPTMGPLAGNMSPLESHEETIGDGCKNCGSIAPSYSLKYNSLYGGQYEADVLKIERFPDGRAVFTDGSNTRWTFRPYGDLAEKGEFYYRPPLGASDRLVYGDIKNGRGYRVENADGDVIEFSVVTSSTIWHPSRYNAADGSWLTYDYGSNGLARITDMHGRYFAFERNAQGLPVTVTDEQGKKTVFAYDAAGHATEVIHPDGFKKQFGYNAAGMMTSVKNGSLAGERYTYDSTGRVLTSESEGGVNRLEHYYEDSSSKTVIADAFGAKTIFNYKTDNGRKLATSVTNAVGGKTSLTYDSNYNIASATDQLGRIIKYVRNNNGDPETITDTLGNTSTIQYQVKMEYRDASGDHTDYYSRPVTITDALGRFTKLDYDSYGNLAKTEDALGNKTIMDYDKAGHMLELRDAMGSTYKYEYSMGLTKSVDPLGRITRYKRDADLHVTQLVDPLGRSTTFTYDLSGNVTEVRNPAVFITKFEYGNGACPSCGGSQLSALTDPNGNTWTFGYDQYGRLTNTANPLGQAKTYNYDKISRVTEVKDPAGNITSYTYDALNRLTKKDIQTTDGLHSITSYTYDAVGNLLNVANGDSSVSYTYDQLNRPIATSQAFDGKTYSITYTYDAVGNRTSMITPWGKYSYSYDALNRLTSILNPQGITAAFSYDAVGRRTSKKIFKSTPELLAEADYTYDAASELLSIANKAGGKVVAFANYEYDAAGNRIKKEDQNGVEKYRYDASNRLITAEPVPFDMAKAEGFVYDKNGNRRFDRGAKNYKYNAANRLLYNSVYTYTHDANGNLTSRTEIASSATVTYAYNPEQQLSEVVTPKDKVEYKYDPLGRRTQKTVNARAMRYLYDGQDIIADLDAVGTPVNTYTNSLDIDEPLIMSKVYDKNYFYHADALGSITAITDDNRRVVEAYTYKSYGQPIIKSAKDQVLSGSAIGNQRLFTAREYEPETLLYNYRARYYNSVDGMFISMDPLSYRGRDLNLYRYAASNPILIKDPSGEILPVIMGVVAVSGLAGGVTEATLKYYDNGTPRQIIEAFGVGGTSAMAGTLAGAFVALGTKNPYLVGAAAGEVSAITNQFLSGKKSLSDMSLDYVVKSTLFGAGAGKVFDALIPNGPGANPKVFAQNDRWPNNFSIGDIPIKTQRLGIIEMSGTFYSSVFGPSCEK